MKLPPGPPNGRFGWDHMAEIRRDLVGFAARLQRDYGDVAGFRLGPIPCCQFTHPDDIHDVLSLHSGRFRKPKRLREVFGRFEGNGLILSEGELWTRQRRIVQPLFQPSRLETYGPAVERLASEMLDRWQGLPRVDVCAEMGLLTMRVVTRTLFSSEIDAFVEPLSDAVAAIQTWSMRELNRVVATPRWLPLLGQRRARQAIAFVRDLVGRLVHERRRSAAPGDDLLGHLLAAMEADGAGRLADDGQVRDELVTFLLAGYETAAAALVWTLWLLARHPPLQRELAAEVRSPADLPREQRSPLSSVEQTFKEAMRLYPPVYVISREVAAPVRIAGYELHPPAQVFLYPWLTHRDARWFPDPERFDPSRFDPEREAKLPAGAWFPFGGGPRACVGRHLATLEGSIVIAAILRRFQLDLPPEAPAPELEWQLSLHPRGPLHLLLRA